jgi:hypothetical protein
MTTTKSEPAGESPEPQQTRDADEPSATASTGVAATPPANGPVVHDEEAKKPTLETSAKRARTSRRDEEDEDDRDDEDEEDEDDRDDEDEEDEDDRDDEDEEDEDEASGGEDAEDSDHDRDSTAPARPRRTAAKPWGHLVPPTLRFVAAVLLLDAMVNVRFPMEEPAFWYLIPSTDIVIILLNYAIMGVLRGRIPRWLHGVVIAYLFLVRFLRFGDGVKERYFAQRFNAYSDLGLIPDGFRFVHSTRPIWEIVLGTLLALGVLGGLGFVCYRALREIEAYFRDRRQAIVALGLFGLTYVSGAASSHDKKFEDFYAGGLAASAMSRLEEEIAFMWNVRSQKAGYGALITETETMLDGLPTDLAKLHGANVYLILVESYGRAMFEFPPLANAASATFDAFEKDLTNQGFTIATGILNSTTYGGQSWLAHATLDTGVPVHGQLEYEIVSAKKPKSIATFFRRAGYRTVLAQPNTTRALSSPGFDDFEVEYINKDFDYHGPEFAWATMPDQYVLDLIRRREFAGNKQPLFIQYVLVSSHAPWARLPTLIDDWSTLGNGSIFNKAPIEEFPIEWPHFENATGAYGKSIIYDFDVLRRYLADYVKDGSLVVILGDHQPVAEVNGDTWEFGVPVHVLSRNPELVRPFLTRGYKAGIRPNLGGFAQGLATFLPNFLVDYSTEPKLPAN